MDSSGINALFDHANACQQHGDLLILVAPRWTEGYDFEARNFRPFSKRSMMTRICWPMQASLQQQIQKVLGRPPPNFNSRL
jgi:hypothetical protein